MKRLYTGVIIIILLGAGTLAQDEARWTGADDLPVSPVACGALFAEVSSAAYDGTLPETFAERLDEDLRVLHTPRQIGVGYYARVAEGVDLAATEMGDVIVTTDSTTRIDDERQARTIDNYLLDVQGLLVAPASSDNLDAVLAEALARGIPVVAYDTDPGPESRTWFIDAVDENALVKAVADDLALQLGGEGRFVVATPAFDSPTHSRWIAELQAYVEACHPGLTWLATYEAGQTARDAQASAQAVIAEHGDSLDAIVGMSGLAMQGAAAAVTAAERCPSAALLDALPPVGDYGDDFAALERANAALREADVIVLAGIGTPNEVRRFLAERCLRSVVYWNPRNLGYAAMRVLRATLDGALEPGAQSLDAGPLGTLPIVGSTVLLRRPVQFSIDNYAAFDF